MDQLLARDGAEGLSDGPAAGCTVAGSPEQIHLQGLLILLLQIASHLPELGQLQPASLSGAATRDAVAFTRPLHGPLHSLVEPNTAF